MGKCWSQPSQGDPRSHQLGQPPSVQRLDDISATQSVHDQAANGSIQGVLQPENVTVKIPKQKPPDIPVHAPSPRGNVCVCARACVRACVRARMCVRCVLFCVYM